MREVYHDNSHDNAILRLIAAELFLRKTKAARLLRQDILQHLKSAGESLFTVITMETESSSDRTSNSTSVSHRRISAGHSTQAQKDFLDHSPDDTGYLDANSPQARAAGPRLAELRRSLLDLSTRNRLLNFKHSNRGARFVRVVDEVPSEIFNQLQDGREIELVPLPNPPDEPKDESTLEFRETLERALLTDRTYLEAVAEIEAEDRDDSEARMRAVERDLRDRLRKQLKMPSRREARGTIQDYAKSLGINPDYDLSSTSRHRSQRRPAKLWQTLLSDNDLQRRLKGIEQQANETRREFGVDTLQFVFGFLEWSPPTPSGETQDVIYSPLILQPVQITKKPRRRGRVENGTLLLDDETEESKRSQRDTYLLSAANAEDPTVNVTLRERLKQDGVLLPELEGETPDLGIFFNQVERLLIDHPHWRVRRFVTLTHLSFSRLPLWLDLDPDAEDKTPPHRHPLLGELFGGRNGEANEGSEHVEGRHTLPAPPPLVLDCDASQLAVIRTVLDGRNLVVQGPPGTGKSQTIANLIAAAMAEGKSILFVAEKQAALEAVAKRLKDVELGPFLLELHSAKANKRDVVESIRKRLALKMRRRDKKGSEEVRQRHQEAEKGLDAYGEAINTSFGRIGWTLHDIIWREANFQDYPIPKNFNLFEFSDVHLWSEEEWSERKNVALEWSNITAKRSREALNQVHPWDWIVGDDIHVQGQVRITHFMRELQEAVDRLDPFLNESELYSKDRDSLEALRAFVNSLAELPDRPSCSCSGLWAFSKLPGAAEIRVALVDAHFQRVKAISVVRQVAPGALEHLPTAVETLEKIEASLQLLGDRIPVKTTMALRERRDRTKLSVTKLPEIRTVLEAMAQATGLVDLTSSEKGVLAFANVLELASTSPEHLLGRTLEIGRDGAVTEIHDALSQLRTLSEEKVELETYLKVSLDAISYGELKDAIEELKKARLFSWLFSTGYRKAKRLATRALSPERKKQPLPTFQAILKFKQLEEALQEHPAAVITGGLFKGGTSDPTPFEEICNWIQLVRTRTPITEPFSEECRQRLWNLSEDIRTMAQKAVETGQIERFRDLTQICAILNLPPDQIEPKLKEEIILLDEIDAECRHWDWKDALDATTRSNLQKAVASIITANDVFKNHAEAMKLFQPDLLRTCAELDTIAQFTNLASAAQLPEAWLSRITTEQGEPDWTQLKDRGQKISRQLDTIDSKLTSLKSLTAIDQARIAEWKAFSLRKLFKVLYDASEAADTLSTICHHRAVETLVIKKGLTKFLTNFETVSKNYGDIGKFFDRIAVNSLCQRAYRECAALQPFRHQSPGELRAKFARYDAELKQHDRDLLVEHLMNRHVPAGTSIGRVSERTERGLLTYICGLERPRTSVRDLIKRSGRALQAFKPCFMMSPLSVAQLIEREQLHFDLVIFDEASQVRPADALSALLRGKQFVVVGDQMQLPPTSFGLKTVQADDPDDDEDPEDHEVVESILELSASAYGGGQMLLWHYRSRDPALIAFSNREFYDNKLQLFPAPTLHNPTSGIHYIPVGGTYSARTNAKEALACAQAAVEFMRLHPKRSLGIVALNRPQADLIELELDHLIHKHNHAVDYQAEWADGLEPLFVKNLESVQGDERDVIFISTVFGPSPEGQFFQRFGPINSKSGHRRLNVLFTRAKHQVVIFSSIPIHKILATPEGHWGVRVLKEYLSYAKTGRLPIGRTTGKSADSPFEEAVQTALLKEGFQCEPQVGESGYFIDLGVRNPVNPDEFILGIECDGAAYHSSRSARDRDRLRQEILEGLGWQIERVWSTDWYGNPRETLRKLVSRIMECARQHSERSKTTTLKWNDFASDEEPKKTASATKTEADRNAGNRATDISSPTTSRKS